MAKRKRVSNAKIIEAWIKQGRGQGRLLDYKPWLTIHDVASKGLSTRAKGITVKRKYHLLSLLELRGFYLLDWSPQVVDIREQYPLLDLSDTYTETLAIARALGIRHPAPRGQDPIVMTTDFLVSLRDGAGYRDFALSVKYSRDLADRRTLENLEIERVFWQRRNVKWAIFTERDVNPVLVKNIEYVHSCTDFLSFDSTTVRADIDMAGDFMFSRLFRTRRPLRSVAAESDATFGFQVGTSLKIVRYFIGTKRWAVDMRVPIEPHTRLSFAGDDLPL